MLLRKMLTRLPLLLLALFSAAGIALPAADLVIASGAKARLPIVLPRGANEVERAAADELANYLARVTGAKFKIKKEKRRKNARPGIYVGRTEFALQLGLRAVQPDSEVWHVVAHGERLVLAGEGPRGTLYAVYHFLEDQLGVRWWTPWEQTVPRIVELTMPKIVRRGEPAFVYRDLYGVGGERLFNARNRINGHFTFLPARYGGREAYGPPDQVHNLFRYLPPDEYFETDPEFYAELDGQRTSVRAQLCFSNEDLAQQIVEKLRAYIDEARASALAKGERPPRLFAVSQNDYNGACECRSCRELVQRANGHESAALVTFINRVARGIAADYPEVLVDTLAYGHTFDPPPGLSYEPNVSLRLAALYGRDFAKPITAPVHRFYRDAIEGWRSRTAHLRIWDYAVTYGDEGNLPLPNLPVLATDLRYYRNHGVEGLFLQFDRPLLSDMRDLKQWIVIKLVEHPGLDLAELVFEFTEGYYGPAGAAIRGYLWSLDEAAARRPPSIGYPPRLEDYGFLDRAFLLEAHTRFDDAEREVGEDEELLERVRRARLSLDRATVLLWEERFGSESRVPLPDGGELWLRGVAERCRGTAFRVIEQRLPERRWKRERSRIEDELGSVVARYEELERARQAR